jgi:hypothetical protein
MPHSDRLRAIRADFYIEIRLKCRQLRQESHRHPADFPGFGLRSPSARFLSAAAAVMVRRVATDSREQQWPT